MKLIQMPEILKQHGAVQLALKKLFSLLEEENSVKDLYEVISAGSSEKYDLQLLIDQKMEEPESYLIDTQENAVRIKGSDCNGVAYGLQYYTEWLEEENGREWSTIGSVFEKPDVKIRGVDKFLLNSDDESWWLDQSYWKAFLERMSEARLNRLCLVTGFDTEYMSPPYPFFVSVDGFEDVFTKQRTSRSIYLNALRLIGQMCHHYGIEFSFACWQQQPWQSGSDRMVEGLENQEKLCGYCIEGVKKLLLECPEIDVIHFRVNHESGVGTVESAESYWLKQIDSIASLNKEGRRIKLELRAKGMTDAMVEEAIKQEIEITVSTKYCCEHAGLPYHLTRMRTQEINWLENLNMARRYSYSDLLRKPMRNKLLYRLWNNGSNDLFTWGDADYVKRFTASLSLGNSSGFEVIGPLTLKGGHENDRYTGWKLFDNVEYQPPEWEDERYWLFYFLFGRIGYNRNCDKRAWVIPLKKRFGEHAGLALKIVELSSKIIPLITSFHFPEHPQLWYWTEMSTGAALFAEHNYHPNFKEEGDTYQDALPCDEGLFYSITEYVKEKGNTDGRYTPFQIYDWLLQISDRLKELLGQTADKDGDWEWKGILLDAGMLLQLAQFHMHKSLAAMGLSHFQNLEDAAYLEDAANEMRIAKEHWMTLSEMGKNYHKNLMFGAGLDCMRRGTWRDYMPEIDKDIKQLDMLKEKYKTAFQKKLYQSVSRQEIQFEVNLPEEHRAGETMDIGLQVKTGNINTMKVRFRHTNQLEGDFQSDFMEKDKDDNGKIIFRYRLDGSYIEAKWDLLVYFEGIDDKGNGIIFPGLWNKEEPMPYKLIRVIKPKSGGKSYEEDDAKINSTGISSSSCSDSSWMRKRTGTNRRRG